MTCPNEGIQRMTKLIKRYSGHRFKNGSTSWTNVTYFMWRTFFERKFYFLGSRRKITSLVNLKPFLLVDFYDECILALKILCFTDGRFFRRFGLSGLFLSLRLYPTSSMMKYMQLILRGQLSYVIKEGPAGSHFQYHGHTIFYLLIFNTEY